MNVVKWNSYYKQGKSSITDVVLRTISLWVAIGLLWLSFFHFTETWLWPSQADWWIIIPWVVMLWALYEVVFPRIKKRTWIIKAFSRGSTPLILVVLIVLFIRNKDGLLYIVSRYLEQFNDFYFTNFAINDGGRYEMAAMYTGLMMLLWSFFWGLSYRRKRRGLLGGFAVTGLVIALSIGMAPGKTAVVYLLFAMLLLFTCDIRGVFVRVVVPGAVVLSLLLTTWFFDGKVDLLVNSSDKLIEWEEGLDFERIDLSNWGTDFYIGAERLDNSKPQRNGRDILMIRADAAPKTTMYFRGFYATEYVDGNWELNDELFVEACEAAGYSEEEAARMISGLTLEVLGFAGDATRTKYDVEYLGGIGDIAYVPYYFDDETINSTYDFAGDYLVSKPSMEVDMNFMGIREGDLLQSPSVYTTYAVLVEDREFREWYNQIAAQYTQVPEGIDGIAQAVELINSYMTESNDSYGIIQGDEELNEAWITNYHRDELVTLVKAYLKEMLRYDLVLETLPEGMDAVEYALTQSHEGYCMHYASAAALILRELGVPTRYASGYVVRPRDFVYSQENNNYEALVEDYNAHAWIEVYYEYIGWVPVEVTASFTGGSGLEMFPSLDELNPENNQEEQPDENQGNEGQQNPDENQGNEGAQNPDENAGTGNEGQENPDENQGNEGGQNPDENAGNNNEGQEQPGDESERPQEEEPTVGDETKLSNKKWYMLCLGVLVLCLVLGAVLYARYQKMQRDHLEKDVHQKQCRRAVRKMNRRIYRMLRLKNLGRVHKIPWSGYLTDVEYGAMLKETFSCISESDWDTYMEIAKKMYYSMEEISEEEMQHCYKCYKNPQMKLLSGKKITN